MVVVVDDDDAVRGAIADVLALEGYSVVTAGDGDEALPLLHEAPRPCVAIIDLVMPRVDGWELVQAIRRSPRLRDIRLVCATASRCAPPKGCRLLRKPFGDVELFAAVRRAFAARARVAME